MMKYFKYFCILFLLNVSFASASEVEDSLSSAFLDSSVAPSSLFTCWNPYTKPMKRMQFVALKYDNGNVLKTNDYVKSDEVSSLSYQAFSLKYGFTVDDAWQYLDHHHAYDGIGLYLADFSDDNFGTPLSIYLFHGGQFAQFFSWWRFTYELNLGYSFGWKHYDAVKRPNDIAVGGSENAHVGGNFFFQFLPSRNFDFKIGIGFTHFSNGASTLPNKGMNLVSPMVELAYRWNDPQNMDSLKNEFARVKHAYHLAPGAHRLRHEFSLAFSKRQRYVDSNNSGLPNDICDHSYRVVGLSYSPLYSLNYKWLVGPSLDLIYDESNNAEVNRITFSGTDKTTDYVHLAPFDDRLQLGLSAKGVLRMSYFSYLGQLGYDVYHQDTETKRFYQMFGVRLEPNKNIFLGMAIRAINFSKAQFVYWHIGYAL